MSLVDYSTDGAVAVITLQHPPVNALSSAVAADLDAALDQASDPAVRAVVTAIAVGSFLILTIVSSCGPRAVVRIDRPTTTTTGITT